MRKIALIIAIILFPFQNIGLQFAASRYDISAFIFLGVTILTFLGNAKFKRIHLAGLILLALSQIIVLQVFNVAPLHRFLSGTIWFGGLLFMSLISDKFSYDSQTVFKSVLCVTAFSSLFAITQYLLFKDPRPKAFFGEPSFAGLSFYSAASGILAIILKFKMSVKYRAIAFGFLVIFCYSGFLTKSLHFITFGLVFLLLVILIFFTKIRSFLSPKKIAIVVVLFSVLGIASASLLQTEHFASRLSIADPGDNLSLLSWLRGFDQMLASLSKSSMLGLGFGSTGYFDFDSPNSRELSRLGVDNLNLADGYSLAFRLVIEIGLPFFLLLLACMIRRIGAFRKYLMLIDNTFSFEAVSIVFNFVFATSLIIGSLIKEPLYAQSFLYLGVFLFSSAKLNSAHGDKIKRKVKYILNS